MIIDGSAGSDSGVFLQVTCSDFRVKSFNAGKVKAEADAMTGATLCALSYARLRH